MGIYLSNGYLNIEWILERGLPFNFIVGARGVGKTYGALSDALDHHRKFIFMRRMQTQIDSVRIPELSPFKIINEDRGFEIVPKAITKQYSGLYDMQHDSELIGYMMALSTVSNIRGFDASDVSEIIFDEFIPERHEKTIKNEGDAFLNAYETINRNRELTGKKPVQLLALANSNELGNPVFMRLNLVTQAERMSERHQETWINRERGIGIFLLNESPISRKKEKTALYKLMSADSDFSEMALKNQFIGEEKGKIKSMNLQSYRLLVTVGELSIYEHRSDRSLYVSEHAAGKARETYSAGEVDLKRFRKNYISIWQSYLANDVTFETYVDQLLFEKYFGM